MQNELFKNIEHYLNGYKKKKQIHLVLAVFSVLVAASVYGALCMPAISMTKDEPKLETKAVRAAYGDELFLRVRAEAADEDNPTVFVLHTESNGAGLSDMYEFEETDGDEAVCLVDTEDGETIELYRSFKGKGIADYWFSLEPEETASFLLYCNSDMDTNLYRPGYASDRDIATPYHATPPDADEDEELDTASPSDADRDEKQYFRIYGGAGKSYKAGLRVAKKQDNSAEFMWSEKLEELTLTAVTESGMAVTMTGPEELFPLGDLELVVSEVTDLKAYKASRADLDEATPADAMLLEENKATPSDADEMWDSSDESETDGLQTAEEEQAARMALAEAEATAASKWLFDIKIMDGDREVEPLGPVEVTFGELGQKADEKAVSVFHIDEKNDKVKDMEAWKDEEGNVVMHTDHFSLYEMIVAGEAGEQIALDEVLEGLGMANQYAAFAQTMHGGGGHAAGNIAVQTLDLRGSSGLAIGNDESVINTVRNRFRIRVSKSYTGIGKIPETCSFGLWEVGSEQNLALEVLKLDVMDGKCQGVFENLDKTKVYVVYELDEDGTPILTPTETLTWKGGPYRGTGNENYIESFKGTGNVGVGTNSGADFVLHVGDAYMPERGDNVLYIKKNGATQVTFNDFKASAQADTNCDIEWEDEFSRLISFSEKLREKLHDYSSTDQTPGVKIIKVSMQTDETIKQALSRTLGFKDENEIRNNGIPLTDNQYVVINIIAQPGTDSLALPTIKVGGQSGQDAVAQRVIWNFSGFTGTVTQESDQTMGTVLVPMGTFQQTKSHNGGVIAETFDRQGSEFHKLSFEQIYEPEVIFTENTGTGTGDVAVNVTKSWSDGNDSHSEDSITVRLLANGKQMELPPLALNSENNWAGGWKNLPAAETDGTPIVYSVEEEPVDGYYPSVTGKTETSEGGWVEADAFTDGGEYLIVRDVNNGKGLAYDSASGLVSKNVADAIDGNQQISQAAKWRAESSGGGFTLTNLEPPNRKLGLYYNNSTGSWNMDATGSTSNRYNNVFYYGKDKKLYTIYTYYDQKHYFASMPNGGAPTTIYPGSGLTFRLYEWQSSASTTWSFTITNTKHAVIPNTPNMEIQKTIDALRPDTGEKNPDTGLDDGDGDMTDYYRLYLDLKAKNIAAPADVVLVLDNSSSMFDNTMGGVKRADVVVNTASKFAEQLLASDNRNRVSVVGYSGMWDSTSTENSTLGNGTYRTGAGDAWSNSSWQQSYDTLWENDLKILKGHVLNDGNGTGTNIMQALKVAGEQLIQSEQTKPEAHRYMIFISDGYPTYYYLNQDTPGVTAPNRDGKGYYAPIVQGSNPAQFSFKTQKSQCGGTFATGYWGRFGSGGENSGVYAKQPTIDYANWFHGEYDDTIVYSIGVGTETEASVGKTYMVDTLKAITTDPDKNYYSAEDTSALQEAFDHIMYGPPVSDVSVTDELSRYVEWYGERPDVLVTMTDKDGKVTELWKGSGSGPNGIVGEPQAGNIADDGPIIEKVTYSPALEGTKPSTGTVTAVFRPDYVLALENTYTLSFNVKTTQTAYDEYAANQAGGGNGYKDVTGDPDTDYGTNDTSSGLPGFHSNQEAAVGYTTEDSHYTQLYDHPVIQTVACSLKLRKTDIIDDAKLLEGAGFDLYKVLEGQERGQPIPGLEGKYGIKINQEMLLTDANGEIAVAHLVPADYCLVEVKAPTGYQLLTKPICFSLSQSGLDVKGDGADTGMTEVITGEDRQPILIVKNTSGFEMPHTGGRGTALYTVIGMMFMIAATLCYMSRLKEKKKERILK